ncbi:MAG: hypothetical protein JJU36_10435 [Phycisphaeraceae bacterium]|nr:hypothetical protein [Phycisphaeraceae bacterium]
MPIFLGFADTNTPPTPPPPVPDEKSKAVTPETGADPSAAPDAEVEEEEEVREEVRKTVLSMMPWAISLTLHAALVLLAVFVLYTIIDEPKPEDPPIPLENLVTNPGSLTQTQTQQTERQAARRNVQTPETTPSQTEIESPQVTTSTVIAMSGGASSMANPFDGDAGDSASPFGGGRIIGEIGGNIRRVVYMIDASGSLIDTLPFVINDLNESLSRLSSEQSFSIIFFQDAVRGGFVEVPGEDLAGRPIRSGLRPANTRNKQIAREWMDQYQFNIIPQGRSDPRTALVPAMRTATGMRPQPQLIVLLSDNIIGQRQYEINRDDLVKLISDLTRDQIAINTIQFIYPEQLGGVPTLQQIARNSGGNYRFVSADDLRISRY